MAVDLRHIIGALRISNDLERIGDLAVYYIVEGTSLKGERPKRRRYQQRNPTARL